MFNLHDIYIAKYFFSCEVHMILINLTFYLLQFLFVRLFVLLPTP